MKFTTTLTAASLIAFSSMAAADQELSMSEMDGVSAGGFAIADAIAAAVGNITSSSTATDTSVVSVQEPVAGQLGLIHIIQSDAAAASASDSDGKAVAAAGAVGQAIGSGLADTTSYTESSTDSGVGTPSALSAAEQISIGSSVLLGFPAMTASASSSAAALANSVAPPAP